MLLADLRDKDLTISSKTRPFDLVNKSDSSFEQREQMLVARVMIARAAVSGILEDLPEALAPECYPWLYRDMYVQSEKCRTVLAYCQEAVLPLIHQTHLSLLAMTEAPGILPPQALFEEDVIELHAREDVWAQHIENYNERRIQGSTDPVTFRSASMISVISRSLCWFKLLLNEGKEWVCTYEQLLMIRDCLMMRKNALLTATMLYPGDQVIRRMAHASFRWQELCLEEYGNIGFELAKSTESLAKAFLSRAAGDILSGDDDSFSLMLHKVEMKEKKIRASTNMPARRAESLGSIFYQTVLLQATGVNHVAEAFGLQKFIGHPLVDPYESGIKSAEQARAPDSTTLDAARALRGNCARLFTEAFIRKHNRWPTLSFTKKGTGLEQIYKMQSLTAGKSSYDLTDWDHVEFNKELDFEYYDNYLELMDDKAIAFYLDEKHLQWDEGVPSSHRRLLLELLFRENFDIRKIIEIIESGDIPERWKHCSLYPKEREFKLQARMFVMLVMEMRAFFAAHEANIAVSVLPYFPQITMTDDKMTVHQRLLSLTAPLATQEIVRLMLELDLSSWNLRWRSLVVDLVGNDLNKLFGLFRVFTTAHSFFSQSDIMVRVAGCRPEGAEQLHPPEGKLNWRGHKGGFEGIIQKLWSICTVGMIETALAPMPVKYTITDQGDNIIVTITTRRDYSISLRQQLKTLEQDCLAACEKASSDVNQELKPEECLSSTTTLTYSKAVYVNGVDYPTAMKFMSRVHPSSAIDFPSYGAYIQAIFSGAYTAAEASKSPVACYYLALVQAGLFITQTAQFRGAYQPTLMRNPILRSAESIRFQLLWPSELGGLPILGPYEFLYKGGGDPLSKSLASLKLVQARIPEVRSIIGMSLEDYLYNRRPEIMSLLQDPYGLPIAKPKSPEDAVADETLSVIQSIAKNVDIKSVLAFNSGNLEDELAKILMTMTPFNPVVARDMLDCSALGSVTTIKKMFLKTRTLHHISRETDESDMVSTLLAAGDKQINAIAMLITQARRCNAKIGNLYNFVELLRRRWEPAGVHISCLTSYLPIDFQLHWDPSEMIPGIQAELRSANEDILYSRGPIPPYLGLRTVEKRSEHGYKIIGKGYAVSALKTLQSLMGWAVMDPPLLDLIDYLSRSRAGINLSDYHGMLAGIAGGSQGHRYAARIGERGASLIGITSTSTFITLDSNSAGYLSATTEDYPIMFQEFFLYMQSLIHFKWCNSASLGYTRLILAIGSEPLDSLPIEALSLPGFSMPPEVPITMRLVQSKSVLVSRRGGPLWTSSIPVRPVKASSLLFPALVAEVTRALGSERKLMGVLDHNVDPAKFRFGISEVKGAGGKTVVDACAIVVLESVLGLIKSTRFNGRVNTSINYLVQQFGRTLVKGLMPILSHPQMERDPLAVLLNLGPSPTYGTPLAGERVLLGYLAERATVLYCNPSSLYYTTPVAIFGSDEGEATLQAVIRMLRKKVSQAYVAGIICEEDGHFIIGSTISRLTDKTCNDETEKVMEFGRLLKTYPGHMRGRESVSEVAALLAKRVAYAAEGHQIYATTASADEIFRAYRSHPQLTFPLPLAVPLEDVHLTNPSCINPSTPPGQGFTTELQRILYNYSVSHGKCHSLASGAFETWFPLRGLFKDWNVLVVGSGLGAAAASAFAGGAKAVWGHDLREHFPSDSNLGAYRPPLVRMYAPGKDYTQTTATLATSGDWFDPLVSRALTRMSSEPHILVLDISSDKGFSKEALIPIFANGFPLPVLFRAQTVESCHREILGLLSISSNILSIWEANNRAGISERVYYFIPLVCGDIIGYSPKVPLELCPLPPFSSRSTLRHIMAYILAPLGGVSSASPRQSLVAGLELFVGMIQRARSRPSYDEWTAIIQAVISCEWLLFFDGVEKVAFLLRAYDDGIVPILSVTDMMAHAPPSFLRYLSKVVVRIAGHLDDEM
jgi:hypothetical protein